nr:hypothetical protein [Actinacidiphila yeochonensis]
MLIFSGAVAILEGIAAILKDDVFVAGPHYAYSFNLTSWGWIHLILGILVVLAGIALFGGAVWARFLAIFLAGLSLIANFMWLPRYPFWALILIGIDVFVIWALASSFHHHDHHYDRHDHDRHYDAGERR